MRRNKKDDEIAAENPFATLDKTVVVQETRAFNETPINPRKCAQILCKLLYLFQHGEVISRTEATDTFLLQQNFGKAKIQLFVDWFIWLLKIFVSLLTMLSLSQVGNLMKDMTAKDDLYRAAAIRALCRITDGGMLQTIERYMKQAIVDKVPAVASAALVSSLHIMRKNPEVVCRWANEIQEAVSSDNHMVQFHALGLLYHIRSNDYLAISKLVKKFSKSSLRSSHALCYLIRIAAKLVEENDSNDCVSFQFIESCLRHKSEMVTYEAASAIVCLPNITTGDLAAAINCLQNFCSSPQPVLRFAAVRTLNRISINYPQAVSFCNADLETLTTDSNRSIATLAITTLLKIGAEASIECLMKQIISFVSEITDEFKIVVVEAIRSLCLCYPRKHVTMMNFLASMLHDEGGFEYKKSIVDAVITIVNDNPEAKELDLSHLCEFIEDCELTTLTTRVLHLLGREGPATHNPQRYVRFIYNRVILETGQVRAAAVTALAKFGQCCPELRKSVIILLNRFLYDTDDDVRECSTFYLKTLESEDVLTRSNYTLTTLYVSLVRLECHAEQYVKAADFSKPFDLKQVSLASQAITIQETNQSSLSVAAPEKNKTSRQEIYAQQLSSIPSFSGYGPLFKSSASDKLSESLTECSVTLIKHIFRDHVVLQFDCKNTALDQLLTEVYVELSSIEAEDWTLLETINLLALAYNTIGTAYLSYKNTSVPASFQAVLKFKVFDVDPATGEHESEKSYDDAYELEVVDLTLADFVQRLNKPDFNAAWEAAENEVEETYGLKDNTLEEAVKNFLNFLPLAPNSGSDKVFEGKSSHLLLLSGIYRDSSEILVKVKFAVDPSNGLLSMHIIVRGTSEASNNVIANSIS